MAERSAPTLRVDAEDPTPAYEQVRRQISGLVHRGVLQPGDRLPSLRQLAGDLGLAVGTVGRAYAELETAGLLTSRRGAGTRITPRSQWSHQAPHPSERSDELEELARQYLRQAQALGVSASRAAAEVARCVE